MPESTVGNPSVFTRPIDLTMVGMTKNPLGMMAHQARAVVTARFVRQ